MANLPSPFAQVITVNSTQYPDGIFVWSVDVCFALKDDSLPITLQIRSVVDGYPSPTIVYHNATATLYPDQINTADGAITFPDLTNSNSYTRFTFQAPIYLPPGDHSLVFQTVSGNYLLWIGQLQDPVLTQSLGSNPAIFTFPPLVGDLFRSQNSTAWTEVPNQCLMFNLNQCIFDTNDQSVIEYDVIAPSTSALINVDTFLLSTNDVLPTAETDVNYTYKSWDSVSNTLATTAIPVATNQNIYPSDRQLLTTANGSFKAYATMTSQSKYVSPILDPTRINLVAIQNIINYRTIS